MFYPFLCLLVSILLLASSLFEIGFLGYAIFTPTQLGFASILILIFICVWTVFLTVEAFRETIDEFRKHVWKKE